MSDIASAAARMKAPELQSSLDIVRMSEVRFTWPGRHSFTLTIDDFSLRKGERLLLIGPSGQRQVDVSKPACGHRHPAGRKHRGARHRHRPPEGRRARPLPRRTLRHYFSDVQFAALWVSDRQCGLALEFFRAPQKTSGGGGGHRSRSDETS